MYPMPSGLLRPPLWIAHRGAGCLAPENTLAAFRHGVSLGMRGFECDVKLSADGVPFLLHDSTLDRTTSGRGLAHTQPWAALSQLDAGRWHSADFAGEPPATLAALLHLADAHRLWLNLELKPGPGDAGRTGETVARYVSAHFAISAHSAFGSSPTRLLTAASFDSHAEMESGSASNLQPHENTKHTLPTAAPLLLSSFQPEALAAARSAAPELPLALLSETVNAHTITQALALGCCAVVGHHTNLNDQNINALHLQGLWALAYTVNQPQDARRLLAAGIDALITDAVDSLPRQTLPP